MRLTMIVRGTWRWRVCWVVGLIATMVAGCAVQGYDLVAAPDASTATTGSSAAAGGGGASCVHAAWPGPPAASDPGSDDLDLVLALRSVDFGELSLGNGPKVGYDLDSRCTCLGDLPSCEEPASAIDDHCDGPGGIDNSWSEIVEKAVVFSGVLSSASFTERAEAGRWSLLVRVQGYNGRPNDTEVAVALYPSPGVEQQPCAPIGIEPKWDGSDAWPVDMTAVQPPPGTGGSGAGGCAGLSGFDLDQPMYVDAQGYVTDSVVVASLPSAGILLSGATSGTLLQLTVGFLTGRLEEQDGLWQLRDGLLVGRWKVEDMFRGMSTLVSGGEPLCTDHTVYQLVKNAVCAYPDISSSSDSPNAPCDAVSFGLAFQATQAQLGAVVVSSGTIPTCPPDKDPALDSCDKKSD